jgi:hypothetical protein
MNETVKTQAIEGSRKVFDKSKRMDDAYFIKLPSNLRWYIYVDGYRPEMNYLYALIVDRYNVDLGYAFPSMLNLSREYGRTEPTTREHLRKLKDVGLIDYTEITGKKHYVPLEPLNQEDLFRQCPHAEINYRKALKDEADERKRSAQNWLAMNDYRK